MTATRCRHDTFLDGLKVVHSFLRFLFLIGELTSTYTANVDLARCTVGNWRLWKMSRFILIKGIIVSDLDARIHTSPHKENQVAGEEDADVN